MSYLVLARKWRPSSFDDVTGQEHVVQTLAHAIALDRVAHAFLLCGPRGVGKTTTARLLARALNCASGPTATPCGTCAPCIEITNGTSVDVAEIDGASNNGVDNVREIRDAARYLPQRDRHKIYVIDEVHMLSVAAFNALLKTLEEPPPHVKFIFATTDPEKLPDTILSRCQRHNFRRVPAAKMQGRLRKICEAEKIEISDRALGQLCRQADGGMRDALSLLDQLVSSAGLQVPDAAVEEALGIVDRTAVLTLAGALIGRDGKRLLEELAKLHDRGVEPKRIAEALAEVLRDLLVTRTVAAPADRSDGERAELEALAAKTEPAQLARLFDLVHGSLRDIQLAAQPRLSLEVALLTGVHLAPSQGIAELAARLEALAGPARAVPAKLPPTAPRAAPPRPVAGREASSRPSVEAPPASDDEEPGEPEPVARPARTFAKETSPGGCATGECLPPIADPSERWRAALAELRKRDPMLAVMLAEGRLEAWDAAELRLGFGREKAFHRAQLSGPSRGKVEGQLCEILGTPVKFSAVEAAADAPVSVAEEKRRATDQRARELRKAASESGAVQKIQALFGADIEEIEVLPQDP